MVTVAAEAEKTAAEDEAESIRILAEAGALKERVAAQGASDAEKLKVEAAELRYAVDAAGQKALNEAENQLDAQIVEMRVRLSIIENLKDIIRESVKPLENIDGIKIVQVDGLTGNGSGNAQGAKPTSGGSLADQVVSSALQYRSQAPLIDALMKEIGMTGGDLNAMSDALRSTKDQGDQDGASQEPDQQSPS